jgi:hypothetical protein
MRSYPVKKRARSWQAESCFDVRSGLQVFVKKPRRDRHVQRRTKKQSGSQETQKGKDQGKTIAAAPSQKAGGWQPSIGSGKKK